MDSQQSEESQNDSKNQNFHQTGMNHFEAEKQDLNKLDDNYDLYKGNDVKPQTSLNKGIFQNKEFKASLISAFAAMNLAPLNYLKSQIQIMSKGNTSFSINPLQLASKIYQQNGLKEFFKASDSIFAHTFVGTFVTSTIYFTLAERAKAQSPDGKLNWLQALKFMAISKVTGAFIAVPFELIALRAQTDSILKEASRRNYKNLTDGLKSVYIKEGFEGLYKGALPSTLYKSLTQFFAAISFIIFSKPNENKSNENYLAKTVSSFFILAMFMPLDNVRARLQFMDTANKGNLEYKGMADCFKKTIKKEGFSKFYAGFSTALLRIVLYSPVFYFYRAVFNDDRIVLS